MENIFHIGQILIHLGVVTNKQVITVRKYQDKINGTKKLGEIMVELGYITEEDLDRGLSLQNDLQKN